MKRTFFLRLGWSIILLVLAACQRSATPASPLFTDAQLTSIASTAQASKQQTQQAYTPTPIPATSTPLVSLITGTSLDKRDDQTTVFVDRKAGIQLTLPAGWLPVRINEDEYYKAYTLNEVANSKPIADRLTEFQSLNADFFRLGAIDIREGHVVGDVAPDITVIFEKDDHRTLEQWSQAERASKKPFKGYRFLSSRTQKLDNGTIVLVIEESWGSGASKVFYRGVFFSLPSGTVVLDFQSNFDFKDTVLPEFEQVVNSLTLLNPK